MTAMRRPDESIPPHEDLYRRISGDQVVCGVVQANAVRLPASSVNRGKYAEPRSVLRADRPQDSGIAILRGEWLPKAHFTPAGISYEVYCVDDPHEDNIAHANVLVGRTKDARTRRGHEPSNRAFCETLKVAIARSMRILLTPAET